MANKKTIKPFAEPGFTMFNNCILDHIMPKLRPNAWKVICVAIRQTWGWRDETTESGRREEDEISYSQFMGKSGIGSKSTLSNAIQECMKAGYLKRRQTGRHPGTGKPTYSYSLNRDYELEIASTETVPATSTETVPAGPEASTVSVLVSGDPSTETVLTKETLIKETKVKERKQSDFSQKPKADPLLLEQERITEKKQAEKGNYADPAPAGGSDNLAAFGLFCLYDKRGKVPPKQGTKEHTQQCDKVRGALRAYGYQQAPSGLVEKAAEIHCERKGDWTNVFYPSFAMDFGQALSDAEGAVIQKDHRRDRNIEVMQKSLAALNERRAARPPPPQDDAVGIGIKSQLEIQMGRNEFRRYVAPTRFTCDDGALVVAAPDEDTRDWLEDHLGLIVKRALAGVADGPGEVVVKVSA